MGTEYYIKDMTTKQYIYMGKMSYFIYTSNKNTVAVLFDILMRNNFAIVTDSTVHDHVDADYTMVDLEDLAKEEAKEIDWETY